MPVMTSRVPILMGRGWATFTERSFIMRKLDPDWAWIVEVSPRAWVSVDCVERFSLNAAAVGREPPGPATALLPPTTPATDSPAARAALRRRRSRKRDRGRSVRDDRSRRKAAARDIAACECQWRCRWQIRRGRRPPAIHDWQREWNGPLTSVSWSRSVELPYEE